MNTLVSWITLGPPATSAGAIDFEFTPLAPLWTSEVLVYLNTSLPSGGVLGKLKTGSQAHPSHATVFVGQAIFD